MGLVLVNLNVMYSAWNKKKVGVVRVLSDKIIRSTIHDLVVDPEFQCQGIGGELLKRWI